ncbi:MAG: PEP-CTERM sorting domain-containing protein [Phycisphaerae bacterium]|nr:PEP-CTERM sorting domain-containing protein [Phycisphaerae bacterium]
MKRVLLCAVVVSALLVIVAPAGAGIVTEAKVLFSPTLSNVGMTVTQSGSDPNDYFLTFTPMVIDAAVINGSQVVGDPCEGWDVLFGPMVVDATSRTVVGGMFALYDIISAPGHTTLTVKDGGTTRLSATLTPQSKLVTLVSGTGGVLDTQAADLTGLVFDLAGVSSTVFDEFAKRTNLDFGFAYSGLDLDKILKNRLAGGLAGVTGHIQLPEPATLALMGLGGLAVVLRRKRR